MFGGGKYVRLSGGIVRDGDNPVLPSPINGVTDRLSNMPESMPYDVGGFEDFFDEDDDDFVDDRLELVLHDCDWFDGWCEGARETLDDLAADSNEEGSLSLAAAFFTPLLWLVTLLQSLKTFSGGGSNVSPGKLGLNCVPGDWNMSKPSECCPLLGYLL